MKTINAVMLGGAVVIGAAVMYRLAHPTITLQRLPFNVAPLAEYSIATQNFNIKKLAIGGAFSGLTWPSYFLPGQRFPEGGLIRGQYTNTSGVPLEIRIRVIDAWGIVCEEATPNIRQAGTTWDFWLPSPGPTENVYMKDVPQWDLILEMLGYY